MKSYLDLIPITAKIHKKQNKMSVFCIILSVFLVTVIFGMADMFIQSQLLQTKQENGNWHIALQNISQEQATLISLRPEVKSASWYSVLNYKGELGYMLSNKNLIICGSDEGFITDIYADMIQEGSFPQQDYEALVTENAKTALDLKIGGTISIQNPDGSEASYTICGFMKNMPKLMQEDSYGIFLTTSSFRSLLPEIAEKNAAKYKGIFYLQFYTNRDIQNTIADIKTYFSLSDQQISENTKLLGLLGQSGNSFMLQIYGAASILFVLVLLAGIFMITSSLNSNIAQRTAFFGMIRCIGATPKQIMRLVRREAILWCRFAIPVGVLSGMIVIWILSNILRFLSPMYFGAMPILGISYPSILSGILVGMLTVLLAARSPARRASKVSPLAAVSGTASELHPARRAANTILFKVDTALGIHHAKSSRKNFFLMVGSFALSIILFLAFSVAIAFMNHALTPIQPWAPDLSIISPDDTCSIDNNLFHQLQDNPVIKRIYGRMMALNIPVLINGEEQKIDLISFDEKQWEWSKKFLIDGSIKDVKEKSNTGLVLYSPQNTIQTKSKVTMQLNGNSYEIEIVGMLSESPYQNTGENGIVICSEETFRQVTKHSNYSVIDIQLSHKATEEDVNSIHELVGTELTFADERMGNNSVLGSYYSFGLFIYGFLCIIALITIFNILNSVAMSVTARIKQYGVFRAIGLSNHQLQKMIVAEASTYALAGCILGSILGLSLHKLLFSKMISFYWGDPWKIPIFELGIIIVIVILSVLIAVKGPIRRIKEMSIIDTISAQ